MALAVISESAIRKAEQAGPDGTAKFVVRLEDVLMPPSEIEALQAQLRARDELLGQVCATLDSLRVAILKRYGA